MFNKMIYFSLKKMKYILLFYFAMFCYQNNFAQRFNLIIGSYNSPNSEGINLYSFNDSNGTAKKISEAKSSNASFLAISKNKKNVYTVNENNKGTLTSFLLQKDSFVQLNAVLANGTNPCHIALSNNNKWIALSNYSSGNVSLFEQPKNGILQNATHTVQHLGKSIDTSRQKAPHVHSAYFSEDNKRLFVADLGIDKIFIYPINQNKKILDTIHTTVINLPAGSGPRHFTFSTQEKYLYVLAEMTGKIFVYKNELNQNFVPLQTITTLPQSDSTHTAGSADIHISPDGNFLYASNRGKYNNLAIYSINKITGMLTYIAQQSTLGASPRNFSIHPSGNFLLAANQKNDEVVIFKINKITGLLTDTGNRIAVGKPVCIKWL